MVTLGRPAGEDEVVGEVEEHGDEPAAPLGPPRPAREPPPPVTPPRGAIIAAGGDAWLDEELVERATCLAALAGR